MLKFTLALVDLLVWKLPPPPVWFETMTPPFMLNVTKLADVPMFIPPLTNVPLDMVNVLPSELFPPN